MSSSKFTTHHAVIVCTFGLLATVLAATDVAVEQVIMPDGTRAQETDLSTAMLKKSYVIDGKRFVERVSSRCGVEFIGIPLETIETRFFIARPEGDAQLSTYATSDQILATGYDPTKKTTFIVHGYTSGYWKSTWMRGARKVFEDYNLLDRYNLIFVDYEKAAGGMYPDAVARSSIIGSYLANFIMKLEDLGADLRSMHLIGHSLGSHVSAFAAKRFKGQIGRISAMDPAGPCFKIGDVKGPEDRLSSRDAIEVDVYHYDDQYLGLPDKVGTYDIYINGGSNQPGCKVDVEAVAGLVKCIMTKSDHVVHISHLKPVKLITERLAEQKCQFIAYECPSYEEFLAGNCDKCGPNNELCKRLGFDFQYNDDGPINLRPVPTSKEVHIATDSFENGPCVNHYSVHIAFEPVESLMVLAKKEGWFVEAELTDAMGLTSTVMLTHLEKNKFSGLLLTKDDPRKFVSAKVQIQDRERRQKDLTQSVSRVEIAVEHSVRLFELRVNFMSDIDSNVRQAMSSNLCPKVTRRIETIRSARHKATEQSPTISSSFVGSNFHQTEGWLELELC